MAVERVDYYSDEEFKQASASEAKSWDRQQEPDVVPCFKCGTQMYQECHEPEGNVCRGCKNELSKGE